MSEALRKDIEMMTKLFERFSTESKETAESVEDKLGWHKGFYEGRYQTYDFVVEQLKEALQVKPD